MTAMPSVAGVRAAGLGDTPSLSFPSAESPDTPGFLRVCQAAGSEVVGWFSAGSGSDLSEELVVGVGPAALDFRVAPGCPPGPAASCWARSSVIMVCQT